MVHVRWSRMALSVGVGMALAATAFGVTRLADPARGEAAPAQVEGCSLATAAATGSAASAVPDSAAAAPWFRLDGRIDGRGGLTGYRIRTGRLGTRGAAAADLAAESFAAGPFGTSVLTGTDDGTTSSVGLLSSNAACSRTLLASSRIVRRATIDPSGTTLVALLLDRATRADLGVWSAPINDAGNLRPLLPPVPADDNAAARIGLIWATDLAWSLDGRRLVVTSCGEQECRVRIIEPATGRTWSITNAGLGETLGLSDDRLLSLASCSGLPCPILQTDLGAATQRRLVVTDGTAIVTAVQGAARIAFEAHDDGGGLDIRLLDPATGEIRSLGTTILPGLRMLAPASRGLSAIRLPAGLVAVGPDGRLPDFASGLVSAFLLRLADGVLTPFTGDIP